MYILPATYSLVNGYLGYFQQKDMNNATMNNAAMNNGTQIHV